jgi:hypothetical protein
VWAIFSEALGWRGQPRNLADLLNNWLTGKFGVNYRTSLSCFAGLAWALWMTRNKICIQNFFPNKALDTVFLEFSFRQKWTLLMGQLEKDKVTGMVKIMLKYAKEFKPLEGDPTDVGFI